MAGRLSGYFLEGAKGRIFLSLRQPVDGGERCVLVVPPFAEEMNKCRRMVALTAHGLAANGISVAVPDLYGTGDSEGEFADANWDVWLSDLRVSGEWLAGQGLDLAGVLAIRLGAALAVDALGSEALPAVSKSVLWQPVLDGERFLTQFLRLRIAATAMSGGRRESASDLRSRIARGEAVEVAGYTLSAAMIEQLDAVAIPPHLPPQMGSVDWIECVRESSDPVGAFCRQLVEASAIAGRHCMASNVVGEPYWSSTEIVVIPDLVACSVATFASGG